MLVEEVQDLHELVWDELLDDVVHAIRLQQVLVVPQNGGQSRGVVIGDLELIHRREIYEEGELLGLDVHIRGKEVGVHTGEVTVQVVNQLQ